MRVLVSGRSRLLHLRPVGRCPYDGYMTGSLSGGGDRAGEHRQAVLLVLPPTPTDALSDEALDGVAGGFRAVSRRVSVSAVANVVFAFG